MDAIAPKKRHTGANRVQKRLKKVQYLGEVVLGISVQDHLSDLNQRVVAVRPDLGQVERVEGALLGLLEGHNLDLQVPRGVVAALDGIEQIPSRVVRVLSGQTGGKISRESLDPLADLKPPLLINPSVTVSTLKWNLT